MHRFMNHLDDLAGLDVVFARRRRTGEVPTRRTGLLARLRGPGDRRIDVAEWQDGGVERGASSATPSV